MRRLIFATMLAATSLSAAVPAVAQSPQAEQRFDAAQARYDRETQLYQEELRRYRQSIARYGDYRQGGGPGAYPPPGPGPGYRDPGYSGPGADNDDRDEGGYDPSRYYRSGPNYQERQLAADDRVYRGTDGRYYCKRNDGTTGLIVGAVGGGILGNVIDGGHSRGVGTLIGGAIGALAGRSVDQNSSSVRCR